MKKPHLFFRNPIEARTHNPRQRKIGGDNDDGQDEIIQRPRDYSFMQESFAFSLRNFTSKRIERESKRNLQLRIPAKIEYIVLNFFDYFDSRKYENKYREYFGLSPILFDEFNTIGYFAINNEDKFQEFIKSINAFIDSDNPQESQDYNRLIRYITKFTFYSSDVIKKFSEPKSLYILELFDSLELYSKFHDIRSALINYCSQKNLKIIQDLSSNRIELIDISQGVIQEIIDNFDVIHTVNSPVAGVIRPSAFNLPIREFGFEINNANDDLPVIGIIDTGVSSQTPLAALIINDGHEFDITGTDPRVDNADHGTGVAAIAALGRSLYAPMLGHLSADAKLLSMKVLDGEEGFISESIVIALIKEAHQKYGTKIFVLTLGYKIPVFNNSLVSNYACSLDSLSNELDILIFISVGNFSNFINYFFDSNGNNIYPMQFLNPVSNLCSPSESMNNISCGAISDNLEPYRLECYSKNNTFPASYTRKFNIDREAPYYSSRRFSKHLSKPDLCDCGGDIDNNTLPNTTGLKVLSSRSGLFYTREIGTSYSAPFLANLAAKILSEYPILKNNMQTVKALIINSAQFPQIGTTFNSLNGIKLEDLMGKGVPNDTFSIYSDENTVTLVLEDSIIPGDLKAFTLQIPEYLTSLLHGKSVIHIDATLCFSFEPFPHNHLCYCPIHMSFGIFKNKPIYEEIINTEGKTENIGLSGGKVEDYKVFQGWSDDYYFKAKLLSNCQKISFGVTRKKLFNENNQFKVAVHSKLHKLLPTHVRDDYNMSHKFSLALTIRELSHKGNLSNRLYNEIILLNNLEAITELEAEAELEN
jgi:hypothetical protein